MRGGSAGLMRPMQTPYFATQPSASSPTTAGSRARPVLYVLHSGGLFGTERMAIATLAHLGAGRDSLLLAPPGAAVEHARALGLRAEVFGGTRQLLQRMAAFLRHRREAALLATGVSHSLAGILLAALFGVRLRHLHVVHGGTDERLSYGRKKLLKSFAVKFVAVSQFVRERLLAHDVPAQRICVVENFLTGPQGPSRAPYSAPIARALVVSRLDPIKRVGLLLDALQTAEPLLRFPVAVYGKGWQEAELRVRAAGIGANVNFVGFSTDVPAALAGADLLVHTCPEEPFGLAILEAMAAGIPVLVPDRGGPSSFIRDGENGFLYRANDAAHLAQRLLELRAAAPETLNQVVAAARATLRERFAPGARIEDYRALIGGEA